MIRHNKLLFILLVTKKTAVRAVCGRWNRAWPFHLVTIQAQLFRFPFLDFVQLIMIRAMEKLWRGLRRGVPEKQKNSPADEYKNYIIEYYFF